MPLKTKQKQSFCELNLRLKRINWYCSRSQQWFGRYMITLCLSHKPLRQQGHTVSHLIPSHTPESFSVFTAQTFIKNGNHKKTSAWQASYWSPFVLDKINIFIFFSTIDWQVKKITKQTLIMQYALMHKWLERLTHTNIHISWAEKIPQGFDRAICVRQTEHKENTRTLVHAHTHTHWGDDSIEVKCYLSSVTWSWY